MRVISADKLHDVPYEGTTFSIEQIGLWGDGESSSSWIVRAKCGFYDVKMASFPTQEDCIVCVKRMQSSYVDGEYFHAMP